MLVETHHQVGNRELFVIFTLSNVLTSETYAIMGIKFMWYVYVGGFVQLHPVLCDIISQ